MVQIKSLILKILFFTILFGSSQKLLADTWKVFFYIDATDDLCDMAIKNITDMVRGRPNCNVDFVIQMHAYDDIALRYRVGDTGLSFIEEARLTGNSKQDFMDASSWAFSNNILYSKNAPGLVNSSDTVISDHVMIIASNHGWGILDPHWDAESNKWQIGGYELSNVNSLCTIKSGNIEEMCNCEANCIDKKYRAGEFVCDSENSLDDKSLTRTEILSFSAASENHKKCGHKGFMFSAKPRVYLNNQDLIDCLGFIKTNLLHGKCIDILAFDTCMGDMFEVGYEVAPFAKYLVGNQSCSLRDGFDYFGVVNALNQGLAPRDLAIGMVKIFDAYYAKNDKSGIYTHAAIDLSFIKDVSSALDQVILQLLRINNSMPEIMPIIMQARDNAPRFCLWPMYTDLVAFCKKIEEGFGVLQPSLQESSEIVSIKNALHDLYAKAQKFVVARCGGHSTIGKAYGFAIYLPPAGPIDDSYLATVFAKESLWINLLKLISESKWYF